MRFFIHGHILPAAQEALVKHGHHCHTELEMEGQSEVEPSTRELLAALEQQQWNLMTTDAELVHRVYEEKMEFGGTIVFLLEAEGKEGESESQAQGIDRLFERYKRLTARRMYTVTPSRVKIRQLPGAAMEG